ncbi:MAG: hypothetical protein ACRBK7_10345 [Acidimicrobiales bacterium]
MARLITTVFVALVMATTAATAVSAEQLTATVAGDVTLYLSSNSPGVAGGVRFGDEDIVSRSERGVGGEQWSMVFDGSAAGLPLAADINGFVIEDTADAETSNILMTFDRPLNIAGLGRVDDSDVVRFDRSSESFSEVVFDGSTVGLTAAAEDVDAIAMVNGELVISTLGNARATASSGGTVLARDEDLLRVAVDGSGLELVFDGSDVDLAAEDIVGVHIDSNDEQIHFAVLGRLIVPGLRGDGDDVTAFEGALVNPTSGSFESLFNGDTEGFRNEQIDGLDIGPPPDEPVDRFETCNYPAGGSADLIDFRALQQQGFDIDELNSPSPLSVQTVFELDQDRMRWGEQGVELSFDVGVPGPLDYTFRAELRSTVIDQPIPIGSTQMYCMRFTVDELPDLYGPVTIFQRFNRDNDGPDIEVELTGANQFSNAVPNDIQVVAWDDVRHRTGVQLAAINTLMVVVYNHQTNGAYKVVLNGQVLYEASGVGTNGSTDGSWPQFGLYPHGLHENPNRQDQIDSGHTSAQLEYADYNVVHYPNGSSNLNPFTVD